MGAIDGKGKQPKEVTDARHMLFAEEYVRNGFDGARAYRVIYGEVSNITANNQSQEILKKPKIRSYLRWVRGQAMDRIEVTVARIVEECAAIAFLDIGDLFTPDGSLLPLDQMPEAARRAIGSFKVKQVLGDLDGTITEVNTESKLKALELLGKMFAMWIDKKEVEDKSTTPGKAIPAIEIEDRIKMLRGEVVEAEVVVEPDEGGVWS